MVSITSCQPSSFFRAAKLISGLFFLVLVIHGSSSLPVNKRQTTESDSVVNIRKQTFWNMTLLTRINMNNLSVTGEDVMRIGGIANNLNTEVLCNMYDLYKDYTTALSTIQPNDSLRSVYSATQYVAWEAMNSACQWGIQINSTSDIIASDGCTLTSITRTCFLIQHYHMFVQKEQVRAGIAEIPPQNPNGNRVPECGSTIIEAAYPSQ